MTVEAPRDSRLPAASRSRAATALVALFVATTVVVGSRSLRRGDSVVQEVSGATMGTTYSAKFVARSLTADQFWNIQLAIDEWLRGVDAAMSTYKADSELSRFNKHDSTEPFPVTQDVLQVFLLAQQVSEASDGAFDITVGPLVNAWGFGPEGGPETMPDERRLDELRRQVGFTNIAIDSASSSLVKRDPLVVADLSAIAKGYAVDGLAYLLVARGFTDFLVEVGGELRSSGEKPGRMPWVVGVEAPLPGVRSLYATMELRGEAVATSGDYRNFWDADGDRYSHIIDPRTGRPLPYVGAAVTVIHERAVLADAWATAMTVLGPVEGAALAERLDLGVIFVQQSESGITETRTRALRDRRLESVR